MYTKKKLLDIDPIKYKDYKLCYINSIEKLDSDYTEETKKYMKTEEYNNRFEREGYFCSEKIKVIYFISEDYIPEVQEYMAYFTPLSLEEQWGDDWNDIPYEHNSGYPYDDNDIELLEVPFSIPSILEFKFPENYGNGNSYWSVKDINMGAIPWLFVPIENTGYSINAGISPVDFSTEILQIYKETGDILKKNLINEKLKFEGFYSRDNEIYTVVLNKKEDVVYFYKDLLPTSINTESPSIYSFTDYHNPIFDNSMYNKDWLNTYESLGFIKINYQNTEIINQLLDRIINPIKFIDGKIKIKI